MSLAASFFGFPVVALLSMESAGSAIAGCLLGFDHLLSTPPPCLQNIMSAGLEEGVTDDGLRALAAAGCGKNLTSLYLECECACFHEQCVVVCQL